MKSLFVALLLAGTSLFGPAVIAADTDTEASAVASLVSIGLANAPTRFNAISGAENGFQTYKATKFPDPTYFDKCVVHHYKKDPTNAMTFAEDSYSCQSTLRTDAPEAALFKMAENAVRASLPSGYSGTGQRQGQSGTYETWSRSGSPDVQVYSQSHTQGRAGYEITVTATP
jgi:hypothetical protein